VPGIEPRRNQTALALLSLVDDPEARRRIAGELVGEEARVLQERAASPEATMLASLATAFRHGSGGVSVSEVAQGFNQSIDKDDAPKSAKWAGWFLRTKLRLRTERVRGVYVVPRSQIGAIRTLARRHGVDVGEADAQDTAVGSAREARPLASDARNAPVKMA
jgi:hypothetical protein